MPFQKGHKLANGGPRKGAGRKKGLAKQLEQEFIKQKEVEAEFGFAFNANAQRDDELDKRLRLYAAGVVMDRIWGKPKEKNEQSGELVIRIVREERSNDTVADAASGASTD